MVEIYNASPIPQTISPKETLGIAKQIDPTKLTPFHLNHHNPCDVQTNSNPCDNIQTNTNNTSAIKTTNTVTNADKEFIKEKAKIYGPMQELSKYLTIFHKFPDIFSRHKNDLGRSNLLQHKIHLKTPEPVYIKQFKIPEGHQEAVKQQVREWLKLGIIQTSQSLYNSPIFMVKKKDGSFRLVQDFRALNQQTYIDKYSMRDVSD
jgi:hypothetical protein